MPSSAANGDTSAPDASVFSRCENGLTVEKDVFVTKKELIQCLWKNGYSDTEINAFEIAFPGDYRFHYPGTELIAAHRKGHCPPNPGHQCFSSTSFRVSVVIGASHETDTGR